MYTRGSKCEHSQEQKHVNLHNIGSYTNASMIEKLYTSKTIDVYEAVQSVNTRKGKSICEFAWFIYNRIYDITYMYTREFMDVSKELQSVSARKGANIWDFAQHGCRYKTINDTIHVY